MAQVDSPSLIREQLVGRRQRLAREIDGGRGTADLTRLLLEVDAALGRIDTGTYGICETCHDTIEADRLLADPLVRFCLDHLTPSEQRALERDLELAAGIQRALLPAPRLDFNGWRIAYHYDPARVVSGDYCDYIATDAGDLYFMLGDVSGKGVAASMLMAHLHAMFRALATSGSMPLDALMERASRVFCESTLPTHYATLVCGRSSAAGRIEICNAGHPPPWLVRSNGIERVEATGLPIGMFSDERFGVRTVALSPGDVLLLCSDGVLDAENDAGLDYGSVRMDALLSGSRQPSAAALVDRWVDDLGSFTAGARRADDVTMMAIERAA